MIYLVTDHENDGILACVYSMQIRITKANFNFKIQKMVQRYFAEMQLSNYTAKSLYECLDFKILTWETVLDVYGI